MWQNYWSELYLTCSNMKIQLEVTWTPIKNIYTKREDHSWKPTVTNLFHLQRRSRKHQSDNIPLLHISLLRPRDKTCRHRIGLTVWLKRCKVNGIYHKWDKNTSILTLLLTRRHFCRQRSRWSLNVNLKFYQMLCIYTINKEICLKLLYVVYTMSNTTYIPHIANKLYFCSVVPLISIIIILMTSSTHLSNITLTNNAECILFVLTDLQW